ncbi:MAG TPA: acyltransferase [Pseudonocardiaceae bacterium]|nr:acyltransferase [Pseudonocardiaceae bacterium]
MAIPGGAERAAGVALVGAATEQADSRRRRLPSLTGLRFVAAALVFVSHTSTLRIFADHGVDDWTARFLPPLGYVAVEFFFVLSGFVLTWSARPTDTARAFWARRAVKIYPNNVVGCALAVVGIVATGNSVPPGVTLSNVFLVQDWAPSVSLTGGINRPSWSLGCEVLFYLMFPLLLPLVRRVPDRLLWPVAAGIVAVIFLNPTIATLLPGTGGLSFPQYWFVYVFPVSRLADFALGIVLARIVLAGRWPRLGFGAAVWLAVAGVVLVEFVALRYALVAVMIAPLALVIGCGAVADVRGTRSPVRGRLAVWLGEVSYAFYIVHFLVLFYAHPLVGRWQLDWPAAVGVYLMLFCVALGLAALLYHTVERPLVRAVARRQREARLAR